MKSVVEQKHQAYPYLKVHKDTGCIILAISSNMGTVINSGKSVHPLGGMLKTADENQFSYYTGKVVLSNN